jgi:competence protein ComEC
MQTNRQPFFLAIPFARLLIILIAGIILQWYHPFTFTFLQTGITILFLLFSTSFLFSTGLRFKTKWLQGFFLYGILLFAAMLLTAYNDVRTKNNWFGKKTATALILRLSEQPVWKTNSIKANAEIVAANQNGEWKKATGKVIFYFEKDSSIFRSLSAGSQLQIKNVLQEIKSTQNPGAFNYQKFCAKHGIFHQAFLRKNAFRILKEKNISALNQLLYKSQTHVLNVLKDHIADKDALSIAEALLIGYRVDLDRDLVQAYSNTGVVHIIAISGLHLALIYALLLKLVNLIPWLKKSRFKIVILLSVLWFFSLLCGASASVLRAAVMFSFLLIGELLNKKQQSINTLAASAFCLLIYDPYLLWDVGFQLSYAAVFSIMLFYKPIYHSIFIKNKLLDGFWQLNAVTLSAQIFTLPMIIYHFHQFPNTFLFSNLIAVPLSSIILYVELILLLISPLQFAAEFVGRILSGLINLLNVIIAYIDQFKYGLTDNLQWPILIVVLAYLIIIACYVFFQNKRSIALFSLLILIACTMGFRTFNLYNVTQQKRMVIYNVPKHAAIDIIAGDEIYFIGDRNIVNNAFLNNFHIKPSRIYFQASNINYQFVNNRLLRIAGKKVIITNRFLHQKAPDILVITGNPSLRNISFTALNAACHIIADGTNARWKTIEWKKQAESLHLRFHSVSDQGPFVLDL